MLLYTRSSAWILCTDSPLGLSETKEITPYSFSLKRNEIYLDLIERVSWNQGCCVLSEFFFFSYFLCVLPKTRLAMTRSLLVGQCGP